MAEAKPTPNQKLRHERERRAWSQQDVADKVGTTPLNVGRWERGVTMPGPYFRQKLSEIFEKTPQELGLLHETPEPERPIVPSLAVPTHEIPPLLWNIPYNRNPLFTGREEVLIQIHLALTSNEQPLALAQPQAISGLGGIGKTQTAVEYAYRYRDHYQAVFWARADSADLLSSDYLTIAVLLALPQRADQDQSLVVKAVLHWFDTHEGWLLILDNADDLEAISSFIPSSGKGHVLLTTRAHSTGTIASRVELDTMGKEEGMFLLLRRAKLLKSSPSSLQTVPETLRCTAQAIVEAVDGLPLALDQAGAYIEGTGCNLSDYLKFYKTRRHRLLRMRGESAAGHPEPVATTWSLSFEKVERANPAAAELLRLCAFLHPDEIPEAMIVEGASELGAILQPHVEDEMELNEAIGELRKYSLVKRDPELKILNIHRLVQTVIRDQIELNNQREWVERIARMLCKIFPEPKLEAWPICQLYIPHAEICVAHMDQLEIQTVEKGQLLVHIAHYLSERGQYNLSESLYNRALSLFEEQLGPNYIEVASVLGKLAKFCTMRGEFVQSEYYCQQALQIFDEKYGHDHPQFAEILNQLGFLNYNRGNFTLAEQFCQRALNILIQVYGQNHPEVGDNINDLGVIYQDMGKFELAEECYLRSLSICKHVLGEEHIDVAIGYDNLASLYDEMGKYEQAEELLQRSLHIEARTVGSSHPEVAGTLDILGQLNMRQGKFEQAEEHYLQALSIREQTLGSDNAQVTYCLNGLGMLCMETKRYEEALRYLQRSLRILERSKATEHPNFKKAQEKYAELLERMNRQAQEAVFEEHTQSIEPKQQ
jgi:tetratricopeptide (TPR) repeat protein/DNA-binding XRE family transcriptional regulator